MQMLAEVLEGSERMADAFVCAATPLADIAAQVLVELGLAPGQVRAAPLNHRGLT